MKKIYCLLLVLGVLLVNVGCASDKVISGVEYKTFGIMDAPVNKNPNIRYKVVWGNVAWGVILMPTIIAPIYFWGFSMYEPVGPEPVGPDKVAR